jgi:hypothetical protein
MAVGISRADDGKVTDVDDVDDEGFITVRTKGSKGETTMEVRIQTMRFEFLVPRIRIRTMTTRFEFLAPRIRIRTMTTRFEFDQQRI